MSEDKILSQEEITALIKKLQMKFGAEGNRINKLIEHDIKLNGYVSADTAKAQQELSEKILKEKDNHENS